MAAGVAHSATNYEEAPEFDGFVTENCRGAQLATKIAGFLSIRS